MAAPAQDKYFLRTLHQEIDLFDRKLAHLLRYDSFTNETDRKVSAGKMAAKRETLARTARKLVADGIEFKDSELPRSFRTEEGSPTGEMVLAPQTDAQVEDTRIVQKQSRPLPSPYAGTIFDVNADVQAYKRNRNKAQRPSA